jgi:hypothetical protein
MTATYEKIATTTLGSNTTDITFSSISGSYTDIVLVCHYASQLNDYNFRIRFNGDTGNNYSKTDVMGSPSGATSGRLSNYSSIFLTQQVGAGTTLSNPGDTIAHIMNYSNTTTYKTALIRANAVKNDGAMATEVDVGLWRNTAAITSITFGTTSGYLITGTTATIYGIKAA